MFVKCLRNKTWYVGEEKFHIFNVDQLVLIFVSIITDVLLNNDQLDLGILLFILSFCFRFDPLHQRDEREHSPAG